MTTGFPAQDTISLNGIEMPGQWILQPTSKVYGWQIQQGFALSGATVFPKGDELVVAPFLVKIWDPDDFFIFDIARTQLLKKAVFSVGGVASYALGISHKELNALGVTAVVVRKTPAMTNNGRGLWSGTVEFLQYRKPIPALSKPNAAIPGAKAPIAAASNAKEQLIQQQRAQIDALRGP